MLQLAATCSALPISLSLSSSSFLFSHNFVMLPSYNGSLIPSQLRVEQQQQMAKAVDDAGLWLPSRFLPAGDKENNKDGVNAELDAAFGFPSEFPYEVDSFGLSSPVGSVAGSTETESSDEEDFFAGLTRRLSQSSLHESRKQQLTAPINARDKAEAQKTWGLAGSPQSTLSGIGSWSGHGSPNSSLRVRSPSPSSTPFADMNDPWEVIYAAAGQVARLKMNGEVSEFDFQNRGLLGLSRANLFSKQSLNQASQIQQQQQQVPKQQQQCASVWGKQAKANWFAQQQQLQVQNRGRDLVGYESVKCTRPLSLPQSAWSPLQVQHQNPCVQHSGSGSQPAVPGGSAVKRGCGGTGVFLPRNYGNHSENRKKTGCAPVLLPAKVVHALNLNIEDLDATTQPRFPNAFATDYDALLARRNAFLLQQRLSGRREEATNYEIRLPQEWTY